MDILNRIGNANPDLRDCEIEGLLYILKTDKELTGRKLIDLTGLPKETLRRFKQSVSFLLVENKGENIRVSNYGIRLLTGLDLKPYSWSLVEKFNFYSEDSYRKDVEGIRGIKNKFDLKPKREFDQFIATAETTYAKSKIMMEKGVVKNKSIAFIGDDDLNSLSLAFLNKEYKNITVFDIDKDIVNFVNSYAGENNLRNVRAVAFDVRNYLEKQFAGNFDTVVFDPPYTKIGVNLFLQRATELLGSVKDFKGKYVFMYFGCSFKSPEKLLKVQELINRYGFSIEDRIEKFARYSGAESIGNASSLYILKANRFTRSPGVTDSKNIYTFENEKSLDEKFPFVDHLVLKIFDVKKEIIFSKRRLLNILENICKVHRLKVIDRKVTEFRGGGMTVSFILASSNLTMHTWPEYSSVHIDLVSCTPIFNKDDLYTTMKKGFETEKIDVLFVE